MYTKSITSNAFFWCSKPSCLFTHAPNNFVTSFVLCLAILGSGWNLIAVLQERRQGSCAATSHYVIRNKWQKGRADGEAAVPFASLPSASPFLPGSDLLHQETCRLLCCYPA